jgi:hypothetical protein
VLALTTIAFDIAALELYLPLVSGGCCVIAGRATASDPQRLADCIADQHISLMQATPASWRMLLDSGWAGDAGLDALCGGEGLPGALAQRLASRVRRLWNVYGPTETTIWSSLEPVSANDEPRALVPIGRPLANTRIHVLDAHDEPVPIGVAGEICIGGDGVARGYLNRADLTASRFVRDPFEVGARLYRTGDLGRRLADGRLEFIGRNDSQVKVRGHRIELGEVEAALLQQAGVREAVVTVRRDGVGEAMLVAYVVGAADAASLREPLALLLPQHMLPAAIVPLEELPLTPNGKVDRLALPEPDRARRAAREYEAPIGEAEIALAAIWAEVLGVARVGRHDDFFALGGHSLLAVRAVEKMRALGRPASVRRLFARPTIAQLAAEGAAAALGVEEATHSGRSDGIGSIGAIQASRASSGSIGAIDALDDGPPIVVPPNRIPRDATHITPALLPLVELTQSQIDAIVALVPGGAANVQDLYPLAPLQQGLLFHHRLAGSERDPYVQQALLAFDGRERLDAYVQALRAVIARHDVLRSAFHWEGLDEPVQLVCREVSLPVDELAIDGDADDDVAARLRQRFEAGRFAFDVRCAPLMHLAVAHDAPNGRWLALLSMHHLVGDNAAIETVHDEVRAVWAGRAAELLPPVRYRDYVAQTRSVPPHEHEAFFRAMLADVDEPTAPYGHATLPPDAPRDSTHEALDATLAASLRDVARAHRVGVASLMHLAWAIVVGRLAGQDDVVIGTVMLGRLHGTATGAERAVGLYANTLPLRLRVADVSAGQAVADVHDALARSMRHENAPLALAQRCSGVAPPAPLFGALLNVIHRSRSAHDVPGVELLATRGDTHYPLVLSVYDDGAGLALALDAACGIDPRRVCGYMRQALARPWTCCRPKSGGGRCTIAMRARRLTRATVASTHFSRRAPPRRRMRPLSSTALAR